MVKNFENLSGLPKDFIKRLKLHDSLFIQNNFLENIEDDESIHQLIIEIDNYCLDNKIIGYHYTNGNEYDFLEKGLIIRSGKEIRQDFVKENFHLFSKEEQDLILRKWKERFDEEESEKRDNCLFFNFTLGAIKDGGAELLLSYYGGEQVYFPIFQLPIIGEKLKNIGIPIILKCTINPKEINTFIVYPWGKIAVSSYHRKVNRTAYLVDQDGYQKVSVNPENIEIIYIKH
jgi:hypothetical protein